MMWIHRPKHTAYFAKSQWLQAQLRLDECVEYMQIAHLDVEDVPCIAVATHPTEKILIS